MLLPPLYASRFPLRNAGIAGRGGHGLPVASRLGVTLVRMRAVLATLAQGLDWPYDTNPGWPRGPLPTAMSGGERNAKKCGRP